jgi:hypothetical protein
MDGEGYGELGDGRTPEDSASSGEDLAGDMNPSRHICFSPGEVDGANVMSIGLGRLGLTSWTVVVVWRN